MISFAITWIKLEITILTEVSQTGKDKYHMMPLNMWNLKKQYKRTYLQTVTSQMQKPNLQLLGEGEEG